jgi:hypothetical protein
MLTERSRAPIGISRRFCSDAIQETSGECRPGRIFSFPSSLAFSLHLLHSFPLYAPPYGSEIHNGFQKQPFSQPFQSIAASKCHSHICAFRRQSTSRTSPRQDGLKLVLYRHASTLPVLVSMSSRGFRMCAFTLSPPPFSLPNSPEN